MSIGNAIVKSLPSTDRFPLHRLSFDPAHFRDSADDSWGDLLIGTSTSFDLRGEDTTRIVIDAG